MQERIHQTALKILQNIGIKLHHEGGLELLAQNGVKVTGQTAFFEPNQLMQWVGMAPASFTLHARNPNHNILIGGDSRVCAPGYGSPSIIAFDGARREALLQDYITFAKLVQQSRQLQLNGGILVQPWDVPPEHSHLVMLYAAALYSDKALLGIPGSAADMEALMQLMSILFGGREVFVQKPRVLTLVSMLSPLQMDRSSIESIYVAAAYGQPLLIGTAPGAGTTGPIDLPGNIALATAEILAGIALSQMIRPGLPVVFGLQSYGADMRSGNISIGSPVHALQVAWGAQLARRYNLPSRGGGAGTDAKSVSVQSGYESMLTLWASYQSRINLIIHCAGILDSYAGMSYEKFMIDLEMMDMIAFYLGGLPEDTREDFSYEVIQAVGPGGEFLTSADTLLKFRTHAWNPDIGLRGWIKDIPPDEQLLVNICKKQQSMLDSYRQPPIAPDIQRALEAYLLQCGIATDIVRALRPAAAAKSKEVSDDLRQP